jgi:hypothetical protein
MRTWRDHRHIDMLVYLGRLAAGRYRMWGGICPLCHFPNKYHLARSTDCLVCKKGRVKAKSVWRRFKGYVRLDLIKKARERRQDHA